MGQPTQRATNYTARSNIDTAQIFLHANGQRPKRATIRERSRHRQRRGLNTFHTHTAASMKRDRRKSVSPPACSDQLRDQQAPRGLRDWRGRRRGPQAIARLARALDGRKRTLVGRRVGAD